MNQTPGTYSPSLNPLKRFNEVDLSYIDRDLENKILTEYVAKEKQISQNKDMVKHIEDFLSIIFKLRGYEGEINNSRCFFGTFYAYIAIDELIKIQSANGNGIDYTFKKNIVPQLRQLDRDVRNHIIEDLLRPSTLTDSMNSL